MGSVGGSRESTGEDAAIVLTTLARGSDGQGIDGETVDSSSPPKATTSSSSGSQSSSGSSSSSSSSDGEVSAGNAAPAVDTRIEIGRKRKGFDSTSAAGVRQVRVKQNARRLTGGDARALNRKRVNRAIAAAAQIDRANSRKFDVSCLSGRCGQPRSYYYFVEWVRGSGTWEPEMKLREDGFAEEMAEVDKWLDGAGLEKGEVYRLVKRKGVPMAYQYEVKWVDQDATTWEPRSRLVSDGLGSYVDAVDLWMERGKKDYPSLQVFMETHSAGIRVMGASPKRDCVFHALKAAYEMLGLHSVVTSARFSGFIKRQKVDCSMGLKWGKTFAFMKYLSSQCPGAALDWDLLERNYFWGGFSTCISIVDMKLGGGVYLVGCSSPDRVGHCFALHVDGEYYRAFDNGAWVGLGRMSWFTQVHFVREIRIAASSDL